MTGPNQNTSRRNLMKAAVAAGGTAGLSACLDRLDGPDPVPQGDGPDAHPDRQHAWNAYVRTDEHGNHLLPRHQVLLYCTLDDPGAPSVAARETVRAVLDTLDEAYAWSHRGLLHSTAYSPAYFDRFDASLPEAVDLPRPRPLSDFETPTFDEQDMLVHLASDRADVVLEADAALRGQRTGVNDIDLPAALTDVATIESRRTGFVGEGLPRKRAEGLEGIPQPNPVPEESPLFMGFIAGFRQNQATEEYVTLDQGPFAGGTTKVVANWRQRLDDWYGEQEYDQRVAEMFSPRHAAQDRVKGVGDNLGADSGIDDVLNDIREQAEKYGRVGHAQKAARKNRDEDGNVRLLRRHFESTDNDVASLHFPSLQREITTFEEVRMAMNGVEISDATPAVRQRVNNGILEYIFVRRRGYFLVPPRRSRALPTPTGAGRS